jgi:hypothetical protein
VGNIPPAHGYIIGVTDEGHNINTISETVPDGFAGNPNISLFFNRPFLLAGNATVTVMSIETRLNVGISIPHRDSTHII